MKVKAIQLGYYDLLRRKPGAVFTLKSASHFTDKWMKALDQATVEDEPEAEPEEKPVRGRSKRAAVQQDSADEVI